VEDRATTSCLFEDVARSEELGRLDTAIMSLPEEQRLVLCMQVLGGMTSSEIGAAIDRPAGTVRSLIHQARQMLKTQLEGVPA